eukprot:CAMPEP_0113514244 /NCGR_PEP_ID=MMETSP0014_2-20120614/40298_1 /TAXON_ID=2857 /ORGANISM="Nitzschia sp." /LENGTH=149 /DNA_ID=CAMNT_0000410713 /DNA_START=145 /DNA_END=594 /DNA_ORIENTATION=+ /assembly_acc=CAM_ASM_000159
MGASMSSGPFPAPTSPSSQPSHVCRCDDTDKPSIPATSPDTNIDPPQMHRPQSFEEKLWDKFRSQPLVPIGCAATAYFLASGIKSFQRQDPRRGQKMMRARVAAQFATLGVFMWYIGFDRINFGVTPQYQAAKRAREEHSKQMEREGKQ